MMLIVIAGCLIFTIPLLMGIAHLDVIITGFYNPEYGAIKEIKELIK